MMRRVAWFSCGAASAVAARIGSPDVIAYCDTGSEHPDNARFMRDVSAWLGAPIEILKNDKYADTWAVWEDRKYLAGIAGAPCTKALKVEPRLAFQRPDDTHIFGYTHDGPDIKRADAFREHYPDLSVEFPLIDRQLTKADCLGILQNEGIAPPLTYAQGFPNANCLPCVKATSAAYWALIRKHYPERFDRMAALSRKLGARLCRVKGERRFIDEIPADHPTTKPLAPECDFLCGLIYDDALADTGGE